METLPVVEKIPDRLNDILDISSIQRVDAGHMMYDKCLVETPTGSYFVKTSDDSLLTDPYHARKMWEYLVKEAFAYDILAQNGFDHIPDAQLHHRSLILETHSPKDGWQWEAPMNASHEYVQDVLTVLKELETVPVASQLQEIDPKGSLDRLLKKGWGKINNSEATDISSRIQYFGDQLHPHVLSGTEYLYDLLAPNSIEVTRSRLRTYTQIPTNTIAHFDARQNNIAWHPEKGVRLVDMSWISNGPTRSDTTMFLIDLHKSGVHIEPYLTPEYFDRDHAMLLIGYWLARCAEPSPPNSGSNVRFHQLASAVTAASLLSNY